MILFSPFLSGELLLILNNNGFANILARCLNACKLRLQSQNGQCYSKSCTPTNTIKIGKGDQRQANNQAEYPIVVGLNEN